MYQELHMWDECIVVAKAKVQSTAALAYRLVLLGKSSGWESIQGLFFSPALPCFCLEGLQEEGCTGVSTDLDGQGEKLLKLV